ncbi:MAG: glycosyltransferase, partial [Gammaproteobacteria bacterium]|nr:glycosyltransferase [Gammaproteobacteria bacterium]NNJ85474.1 glycosyltransferase [Gammaproteobacteria bacterium]
MTRLLVDGISFQLNDTDIARVWCSVLEQLAQAGRFEIYFLDRGNAPEIDGIQYIPFPRNLFAHNPADSMLIQRICDHYAIDVFTSTYYTSPMHTPMLLVVHDMIPELFNFDLSQRIWMEKDAAISYAQRYLCVSENTRRDLLALYPEIPSEMATMAHCGIDEVVFRQRNASAIANFQTKHALERPYFLFVGSRAQHGGYENSDLFFEALARIQKADFDILYVGGEHEVRQHILDTLPKGVCCNMLELTDDELALAYGGALALVYPFLYEGFAMPIIEAMASGCPVITTGHGSLAEAADDAALLIDGESVEEMHQALMRIQDTVLRETLRT